MDVQLKSTGEPDEHPDQTISNNETTCFRGSTHSTTNDLVAPHLLSDNISLSTTVMQTVLDLSATLPESFDKASLSFRSYADAYAYNVSGRINGASRRSHVAASLRNFPPVVLDNIIDVIDNERVRFMLVAGLGGFDADILTESDDHVSYGED